MKISTKNQILAAIARNARMSPRMTINEVTAKLSEIKARSRQDAALKIAAAFGYENHHAAI